MEKINGIPFGWKNSWFVFKTIDYKRVKSAISRSLKFETDADLATGVTAGWDGEWTLLRPIEENIILLSSSGNLLFQQLEGWSKEFGEVHFYASHSSSNYLKFVIAKNGKLSRHFAVSDDEVLQNSGDISEIEFELASKHKAKQLKRWENNNEMMEYIQARDILSFLGEFEDLMQIAEVYSINTYKIDQRQVDNYSQIYSLPT